MNQRPPLVLIPQHFGSLVFDRRSSRYLPFDKESTSYLTRLRTEAVEVLAKDRPDLMPFFEHFTELGYFDLSGRFVGDVLDLDPPPEHLAGPLAVHLEVVAACNLTCRHCFAGPLPRNRDPLQFDELDTLFETLATMGSFRLGLTGGEPLLRHDLLQIVDAAVEHGLHPCLTTNGLLITEQIAEDFGKREFVWLNVSLDGASAASNDRIRGVGTFDRVMRNLSVLRRHARFTLAFTIMSSNNHEVQECAALAQRVGADAAVFRPMYPVGIGKDNMELMPTFAQYTDALQTLVGDLHGIDPFSPHARAEKQARIFTNNGCGAGNLVCSISVCGDVNPCSFLGTTHDAGNIRCVPFQDIWHDSHGFRSIRNCHDEPFCGGCRARSQAFGGSIHAPDPWHDEWAERRSYLRPLSNMEA
jgi:MoaA/NifB/PqqE/SkfB family radical SAM enzyme